jgi:TolA-binding protein
MAAFQQVRSGAEAVLRENIAFRLGLTLYHTQAYPQAIQTLQAFLDYYTMSPHRDEALFWLAEAFFQHQAYALALTTYRRILPESRLYDYALHGSGWAYMRLQQWVQARDTFQMLVTKFPNSPVYADALYHIAKSEENLAHYQLARQTYEQYLMAYPQGPLAPMAYLQLALLALRYPFRL